MRLYRFDKPRQIDDVWMRFQSLTDFGDDAARSAFSVFPRDPEVEGTLDGDADKD